MKVRLRNYSIFCLTITLIASVCVLLQYLYYYGNAPFWWKGSHSNVLDIWIFTLIYYTPLVLTALNIILIFTVKSISKAPIKIKLVMLTPLVYSIFGTYFLLQAMDYAYAQ